MDDKQADTIRYLPVLNERGELLASASLIVCAYMQYPNDDYSVKTMLEVFAAEKKQSSRIASLLQTDRVDRTGRAKSSGEVVRCMSELYVNGFPCTKGRAVSLASHSAKGTKLGLGTNMPVAKSGIEAGFKEFKDVAHFWAAAAALGEDFPAIAIDERALIQFLAIAERYLWLMQNVPDPKLSAWTPWLVPEKFGRDDLPLAVLPWNAEFVEHARAYTKRGGN